MTPLTDMLDAVRDGTADPIARAVVAIVAIRLTDLQAAQDGDLERLIMECRATVASTDMVLRARQRIGAAIVAGRADGCRLNQPTGTTE